MKKILIYIATALLAGGIMAGTEIYNAVFYGSITAGEWNPITGLEATTATNGTYTNAATWYYRITGTNSLGRFPYSTNDVTATIDGVTDNAVLVSWDYTSRLRNYVLERGTDGIAWDEYTVVNPAVTSAFDDGNLVWVAGSISNMAICPESSFEQIVGTNHNALPGLQGGVSDVSPTEYFHLGEAVYDWVLVASNLFNALSNDVDTLQGDIITNAYAQAGAAFDIELDGQQIKMTYSEVGMTTYDAGDSVLVRANRTNVTAVLVGTTYTVDGDAGTVVDMVEIRHDVALGSSYSLVMTTNVLAMVGTRRVTDIFQAANEFNGNLIAGAQSRPDPVDDTKFNVIGLSAGGMTHALCKHLF